MSENKHDLKEVVVHCGCSLDCGQVLTLKHTVDKITVMLALKDNTFFMTGDTIAELVEKLLDFQAELSHE